MNYQNIYSQIIEKRKLEEPKDCYTEVHHIIPRSLGGSDDKDNLVKLTAREHFICHYLLAKMHEKETLEWYKMNHAFLMMKCGSICNKRYYNSILYESLKCNFSSIMSFTQAGTRNSQYGTMWICNIELQENKKIKKDDTVPVGWIKGRNRWVRNNPHLNISSAPTESPVKSYACQCCGHILYSKRKYCNMCRKDINIANLALNNKNIRQKKLKLAMDLYNAFIDNRFDSLSEFCRSSFTDIIHPGTLLNLWKKNIPDRLKELQKRNYKPL